MNYKFSTNLLLKIVIIILFILITIYLLYQEYTIVDKTKLEARKLTRPTLLLIIFVPAIMTYRSYFTNKDINPIDISNLKIIKTQEDKTNLKVIEKINKNDERWDLVKKQSIFNLDFNFSEFIKGLSPEELLALGSLFLNYLVLNYTITIILILYGDYLIKRFDLENKYPKIAKFIQLRRKLQQYYLKISFTWIFLALVPQILTNIFILYAKLVEIFI